MEHVNVTIASLSDKCSLAVVNVLAVL